VPRTETDPNGQESKAHILDYAQLPPSFFVRLAPTRFPEPTIYVLNDCFANILGLDPDWLCTSEGLRLLSGAATLDDTPPIAMAYAGHQFGHYAPLLGDGRAMLVGEGVDRSGRRYDLHLKGSGTTPFSRGADGRLTLGAAIREYVMSEAMAALNVPTTRSLAILTTGETILRDKAVPGAVLARTARSHVRIGTFQYAATSGELDPLKALADFSIDRLYPEIESDGVQRYQDFLSAVAKAQGRLIAKWMSLGFIHGVMNTDNASIAGETIDYGPCAFMDVFHPAKVFSSIDRRGRYAWNRQAEIGQWNMGQLAQSLLPLLGDSEEAQIEAAQAALSRYVSTFQLAFHSQMANKLGVDPQHKDLSSFIAETFAAMAKGGIDFTSFFTALTRSVANRSDAIILEVFQSPSMAETWLEMWHQMRSNDPRDDQYRVEAMRRTNPVRIPRNHQVERAVQDGENGKPQTMIALLAAVKNSYAEDPAFAAYEQPPKPHEIITQTFCGT